MSATAQPDYVSGVEEITALPVRAIAENEYTLIRKTDQGWQTLGGTSGPFWYDDKAIAERGPWNVLYRPAEAVPELGRADLIAAALQIAAAEGWPEMTRGVDYPDSGDDAYKPILAYERDAIESFVESLIDAGWRPPVSAAVPAGGQS